MSHIISHKRKLLVLLAVLGYSQVSFAMEAIDGDAAAAPTSPERSPFVLGARKQKALEAERKKLANQKAPKANASKLLDEKDIALSQELSTAYQLPVQQADALTTEARNNPALEKAVRSGNNDELREQNNALPADSPAKPILDKILRNRLLAEHIKKVQALHEQAALAEEEANKEQAVSPHKRSKSEDGAIGSSARGRKAQKFIDFGVSKQEVIAQVQLRATEELQRDNRKNQVRIAKLRSEDGASKARIQQLEEEMKQLSASIGAKDALAKEAKEAQEKLKKLENEVTQLKANNGNDNKKPINAWYTDNKGLIGAGSFVTIGLVYLLLKHFKSKSTAKPAKAA